MLEPGALVLDQRFRVIRLLGRGGMGDVYLAEQVSLGREVALKVLRQDLSLQPGMSERFRREAKLLSSVDHPAVVRVIDFGQSEHATCLIMEHVEGDTLRTMLRQGPLLPDRAILLLTQLAEGLAAIHEKGIVHRDLKPDNVVLTQTPRGEQARLLDFGIARLMEAEGQDAGVSQVGVVLGTPEYLSPEQAMGQLVGPASDLYSFGVLAYHMLSGTLPFHGPSPREFLTQHATARPEPLEKSAPHLNEQFKLRELVSQCLEKEPGRRPPSATQLADQLQRLPLPGEPTLLSETALGAGTNSARHTLHIPGTRLRRWIRSGLWPAAGSALRRPLAAAHRAVAGLPRPKRVAMGGLVAALLIALGASLWVGAQPLRRARRLLVERHSYEALRVLDQAARPTDPEEEAMALLLRAAALHRLDRHREEASALRSLTPATAVPDVLTLSGPAEDYGKAPRDEPWKAFLASLPPEATRRTLLELAEDKPSWKQWGALRFLDTQNLLDAGGLVKLYLGSLDSQECAIRGIAATRLGQLGDEDAEDGLVRLKESTKRSSGFFDDNCGQEEAAAALASIRRKKGK